MAIVEEVMCEEVESENDEGDVVDKLDDSEEESVANYDVDLGWTFSHL